MKSSILLLTLASLHSVSAMAGDLTLVVLKKGEIAQSSFVEVSRNLVYSVDMEGANPTAKWKQTTAGMVCQGLPNHYSASCAVKVSVVNRFSLNEYTYSVVNESSLERSGESDGNNIVLNADLADLKATDFAGSNSGYLDAVYDVNSGTIFPGEHHASYMKQIRLYVDSVNKQVKKFEVVNVSTNP